MKLRSQARFLAAVAAAGLAPTVVAIDPKTMLSANQYTDALPNPSGVRVSLLCSYVQAEHISMSGADDGGNIGIRAFLHQQLQL